MSGTGAAGGFDFQARAIAFVYVQVLAERALSWTRLATNDVPTVVHAEGGGSGDDIRIELRGSSIVYECQAKRGLRGDARLDEAVDKFATGLLSNELERGILVVDPTSTATVRHELREGLDAYRQGRLPVEQTTVERVLNRLTAQDAAIAATRMWVRELDVEQDASPLEMIAIRDLESLLVDASQAAAAWGRLVSHALSMCRTGGKQNRTDLVAVLGSANIRLIAQLGSTDSFAKIDGKLDQVLVLLNKGAGAITEIVTPAPSAADEISAVTQRLDAAREVLNAGRAQSALDLLLQVEIEANDSSRATRTRLHNLKGAALLQLEDLNAAHAEIHTALVLDPDNEVALANIAFAKLLSGEPESALSYAEQLLQKNPKSQSAWSVIVQLRADAAVPSELSETPELLAARGYAKLHQGEWKQAIELLSSARSAGESGADVALMLGQAMYNEVIEQSGTHDDVRLGEARELVTVVLEGEDTKAASSRKGRAYLVRGSIERARGNRFAAVADFNAAMQVPTVSVDAAYQLSQVYLLEDAYAMALGVIDAIPEANRSAVLIAMQARVYLQQGYQERAKRALQNAVSRNEADTSEPNFTLLAAEIAIDAGWADDAERYLGEAPDGTLSWLIHLLRARLADLQSQSSTAESEYEIAIAKAGPSVRFNIRTEYAEHLRQRREFSKAIALLEDAGAPALLTVRALYARLLYEAKAVTKISTLIEVARSEVYGDARKLPRWALNLGVFLAQLTDDVPGAIAYLSVVLEREPSDIDAKIHLVQAHLRSDEKVAALPLLRQLREVTGASARQLLQIAEMSIRGGEAKHAIPLAYRALRLEPGAPDVQLAYVNIFVRREEDIASFDTDTVGIDTHVVLKTTAGDEFGYLIVGDGQPDAWGELAPTQPLAAQLLGKRVGETVRLRKGALSEIDAKVIEIKSHLVFAFQDILQGFAHRNPDSTALQPFRIPSEPKIEDLAPVLQSAEQRADYVDRVLDQYSEQCTPLGFVARLLGQAIGETYGAIVTDPKRDLFVEPAGGGPESQAAAGSSIPAVVTRSAIETIIRLDLFDVVTRVHSTLVAPRSLLDEMREERDENAVRAKDGYTVLGSVKGQPQIVKFPAAQFQQRLESLESAIAWVEENCEVRARPVSSFEAPDAEQARELIGASSFDSVALAQDLGGHLFADDLGLRQDALSRTGNHGFSTFGVLMEAHRLGVVDEQTANLKMATLIVLSHEFLPMTAAMMHAKLAQHAYRIGPEAALLLDRIEHSDVQIASLAGFCAEVLRDAALGHASPVALTTVTFALCEAVAKRFAFQQAQVALRRAVEVRFGLLPEAHDVVQESILRYSAVAASGGSSLVMIDSTR